MPPTRVIPCCEHVELNFCADSFPGDFLRFVKSRGFEVVEFQFKACGFLGRIDITELRKICHCGCTIHGKPPIDWEKVNALDYRIFVSERLRIFYEREAKGMSLVFPNGAEADNVAFWKFSGQKKALLISRLDVEKFGHVVTFVELCRRNGLQPEIAGKPTNKKSERALPGFIRSLGAPGATMLGRVQTGEFLRWHVMEYRFVASVGLAALEAGLTGAPVLIPAETGMADSSFLTYENWLAYFNIRNFTINPGQPCPKDKMTLSIPQERDARVVDALRAERGIAAIARRYERFIAAAPGGRSE